MKTTKRIAEAWEQWNYNEYMEIGMGIQYLAVTPDGEYRDMTKWELLKYKTWRLFPRWFRFTVDCLKQKKKELICKVKGHDMQSEDHCSPDSGYMGCSCKRCGQSWGQWMY